MLNSWLYTPKVFQLYSNCIRIPYTAHATTAEVRLRAGSPPQLLPLIQTRRLRFFRHVARMVDSQDTSRALYRAIRGLPKDWRRRLGRPRRTWLWTMEADLQPLDHGLNSAWRLAQDRERWKQLVETATLQSGACPRWWWWQSISMVTTVKRWNM